MITIDTRGSHCPTPIIELSTVAEREGTSGTVVTLLADDPNTRVDVPVWCRLRRHTLIEVREGVDSWTFTVRLG